MTYCYSGHTPALYLQYWDVPGYTVTPDAACPNKTLGPKVHKYVLPLGK